MPGCAAAARPMLFPVPAKEFRHARPKPDISGKSVWQNKNSGRDAELHNRKKLRDVLEGAFFLGPVTLIFIVVVLIPFIMSACYSFTNWNGVQDHVSFVGVHNFRTIFNAGGSFFSAFCFTAEAAAVNVVFTNCIGIALAVALTAKLWGGSLFRAAFFLPNTMGGIVMGFIWQFLFVQGLPEVGRLMHIPAISVPWLGTTGTAFAGLVIVSVWHDIGYVMVIMIAALVSVPEELVEAAQIDGASKLRTFFSVRLPNCMPYLTVCLFWTISNNFKMFDLNVALTNGGPYGTTTSIALKIYNDAFQRNKYGLATAESMAFFLIITCITLLQMYFSRKKEEQMS